MTEEKKEIPVLRSFDQQIQYWVEGKCFHCDPSGHGPQCCPDFSCCKPHLLQPVEVRKAFQNADQQGRHKFLMAFLGGAINDARPDLTVFITSGNPEAAS